MHYGGFWKRFGAYWIDVIIMLPLGLAIVWLTSKSQYFQLIYLIPGILIGAWYHVYLVKQYGGTPGKLIMKLRIAKLDGTPVGTKEAFLRYSVLLALTALTSLAIALAAIEMSNAEYHSLTFMNRGLALVEKAPSWYGLTNVLLQIWIWSEFVVLLTNKERRALHDFMAGTVVLLQQSRAQHFNPADGETAVVLEKMST